MKNVFKKIICVVFAISMVMTMAVSASANEKEAFEEYVRFDSESQDGIMPLMESNGDFIFEIEANTTSAKFVADSDTIKIKTKAYLYSVATEESIYDIDRKYTITLYKDGWLWDSEVGVLTAYSDWIDYSAEFSVKEGSTYYFRVAVSTSLVSTPYIMKGQGNVSPITLK